VSSSDDENLTTLLIYAKLLVHTCPPLIRWSIFQSNAYKQMKDNEKKGKIKPKMKAKRASVTFANKT